MESDIPLTPGNKYYQCYFHLHRLHLTTHAVKGGIAMLEKIEINEIMTTQDAVKKYPTKYFMMVITEIVDRCDNDLGYVIYTADDQRDLMKASMDEYKGQRVASMYGTLTEPYPSIGNVVYYE